VKPPDPRRWELCPQIPREGREGWERKGGKGNDRERERGEGGNGKEMEGEGKFASLPLGDRRPDVSWP